MKSFTKIIALSIFLFASYAAQAAGTSTDNRAYYENTQEARNARRERVRNYREQSSDLQQKINALGTVASPTIYIPILFGVNINSISPNFGDYRAVNRIHEGEDIMGVKGTPIISPTSAVVLRVGTGETEGLYVYTANPGGETFVYMHLDKIGEGVTEGSVLSQGSLIGYVGDTGNAANGPAHLHFEIHNTSGDPMDPYPRLKQELPIQEKINYLTTILNQTSNANTLSEFLVKNFRSTFTAAVNANIVLPAPILNAMISIPATVTPSSAKVELPAGDMTIGSSGIAVTTLQKHLINAMSGTSAARLKTAGATGYFGAVTQSALLEYQVNNKIYPSNGYYGASTRAYIASLASVPVTAPVASTTLTLPPGVKTLFPRNLSQGMSGTDVQSLQQLLNGFGFTVATSGAGSVGKETTFFGPATTAAVIKYQKANSISPTAGFVGPLTIASLIKR